MPAAPVPKRAFSFQEAAKVADLSRATLHRAVIRGHLKVVQIGKRRLIEATELTAYLLGTKSEPQREPPHSGAEAR